MNLCELLGRKTLVSLEIFSGPEDCPLTPVPVRWFDRTRSLNSVSALRGSYWLGSLAGSNLFIYVFGQTERLTDRDIPFSSESSQFV